jgi:hypothetical protein
MYPSTVLSPFHWCPSRYVLCELEMKYSGSGLVMSWCTFLFLMASMALSGEER